MTRSMTLLPANDNQPASREAISLLAPLIDILARQAVRPAKPANDNRPADVSEDLS